MRRVITVDGPSGVGKGTLCRQLSQTLGWAYLDSGAVYRAAALAVLDAGLAEGELAQQLAVITAMRLAFREESVWLNGVVVGERLRSEETAALTSVLAAVPEVRAALLTFQREFAAGENLIADGRDMGTVIFPDADLKFFLTASPEIRAERRFKQLKGQGACVNLSSLASEIARRDARDATRAIAPLKPASDAVVIDTQALSVAEVVALASKHIAQTL